MAPPSSGGVILIEMLNMIERLDLKPEEFGSTTYVHTLAEVMRRAYADRAKYLGDPDFNPDMPLDSLMSEERARRLVSTIDPAKASGSDSSLFNRLYEGDQTTHLSVVDAEGDAVSLTYTLEYSYGSKLVVDSLGFILNNEMGDFNPVPGLTNSKGLIGTPPNLVAPGKRMLSSMSPTIITKDDEVFMVIGSPGGRTIINSVLQTIVNVIDFDMDIQSAIEAGKIHHQWLPDRIVYEEDYLEEETKKKLIKMGHTLYPVRNIGSLMGIIFNTEQDVLIGGADPSSPDGGVAGY
jgi:gamma-glutamyltranspeptidase/glutathione hydrolase